MSFWFLFLVRHFRKVCVSLPGMSQAATFDVPTHLKDPLFGCVQMVMLLLACHTNIFVCCRVGLPATGSGIVAAGVVT